MDVGKAVEVCRHQLLHAGAHSICQSVKSVAVGHVQLMSEAEVSTLLHTNKRKMTDEMQAMSGGADGRLLLR